MFSLFLYFCVTCVSSAKYLFLFLSQSITFAKADVIDPKMSDCHISMSMVDIRKLLALKMKNAPPVGGNRIAGNVSSDLPTIMMCRSIEEMKRLRTRRRT